MWRRGRREEVEEEDRIRECIQLSKDWLNRNLEVILVENIRKATERPPIWWQFLGFILTGILGGVGLGILIAYLTFPKAPIVPAYVPPLPAANVTIPGVGGG